MTINERIRVVAAIGMWAGNLAMLWGMCVKAHWWPTVSWITVGFVTVFWAALGIDRLQRLKLDVDRGQAGTRFAVLKPRSN
jgi:hypothetical protein